MSDRVEIVRRIHASAVKFVLAVTGGGSGAIADLLEEPGGSRVLIEAIVPYSASSLADWLGSPPEHFCSARTARAMAMAGWLRARQLERAERNPSASTEASDPSPASASAASDSRLPTPDSRLPLAGVACTASLASDRPKRGPHRLHIAWQTDAATACYTLELVKGARDRRQEEQVGRDMILNAVAEACGVGERLLLQLSPAETELAARCDAPADWRRLLRGDIDAALAQGVAPPAGARRTLFSGAFNPLHAGHQRIAELAERILGAPVEFEISILNVDKPPLDFVEMQTRLAQFASLTSADGQQTTPAVWFTRAATFEEKSKLFPGATFLVGADTIRRIADPHYYGDSAASMEASIARLAQQGARFLVFGRSIGDRFVALRDLGLPATLAALCQEVPAEQFHVDVSSTALRRQQELF